MSEARERRDYQPFQFITGKIRNKLLVILLSIALGTIVTAAVALVTMELSNKTMKQAIEFDGKIVELGTALNRELMLAREQDQLYFLNYQQLGFENARAEYVDKIEDHLKTISGLSTQIRTLEPDEEDNIQELDTIKKDLAVYETSFFQIVDSLEKRGYKDKGIIGEFRANAHELEDIIDNSDLPELQITLLTISRDEKNYLLHGERRYSNGVYEGLELLKNQINNEVVSPQVREKLLQLADSYSAKFNQLVEIDKQVTNNSRIYRAAFDRIHPHVTTMVEFEQAEQAEAIEELEEQNALALIIVVAATAVTLLLSIFSAFFFSRKLTRQIDNIMDTFGNIGIGDFESRADIVTHDELGEVAESLNAMLDNTLNLIQSRDERDAIQNSIMKLLTEISDLADGDLTIRAEVTEEITGAIADSFNSMAEELGRVVRGVKDASQLVGSSSHQVNEVTRTLSRYSEEQAQKISEAISMVENMATQIREVSNSAKESSTVSDIALHSAQEGAESVKKTNDAMASIKENMRGTASTIKRLGESSQEIGNIIQIINDIADRTSVLALNASIQAAMAGDAGRGFAVVAEEVQRLAERSAASTKQIESLINTIQSDISVAGTSMETSIQYVVDGTQLADEAHLKLGEIEDVSQQLAKVIQDISATASQQAEESSAVTGVMQEVGKLTEQTTASAREASASMEQITSTSEQLESSIAAFTIDE